LRLHGTRSRPQFSRFAHSIAGIQPASRGKRPFRLSTDGLCLIAVFAAALLLGCNTYNPNLGASPTITSSISSISPSGATAGQKQDINPITVFGSGFVTGSIVTWNANNFSGNSSSTDLVSTFVNAGEMQATISASLLATPSTFFIGVRVPGPTTGNTAGNGISNFVTFVVFPPSGSSVVSGANPRVVAAPPDPSLSRLAALIQAGPRYQPSVADTMDPAIEPVSGIASIFLRDTCLNAAGNCVPRIIPISVGWNGTGPNGPSRAPSATADGRFVVFESEANNLVKGDSNGWSDIFLRDTCIGASSTCVPATTRLSVAADGSEANGVSFSPAISPDGRFVEFNSLATNLARLDFGLSIAPAAATPLFLRDTCFGATSACMPATSRIIPASASQR
jgi:hypothetical protein